MGYYMGDYYGVGGFYRGDPFWGSLFSGISKVFTKGASIVKSGLFSGGGITKSAVPPMPGGAREVMERAAGRVMQSPVGKIIVKHPVLSAAGAAGALGTLTGAVGERMMGAGGACPKGHHISKKHGHCVRNRRMNPCNGRALRRAIRRAHAFERIAKHVIGFSSPRKPRGHMYFKRRRKK